MLPGHIASRAQYLAASVTIQVRRHHAIQGACAREIERYAAKRNEIETAISIAADEIEQAKITLQEAQILRANLEEYEVGTRSQHPERMDTTEVACAGELCKEQPDTLVKGVSKL